VTWVIWGQENITAGFNRQAAKSAKEDAKVVVVAWGFGDVMRTLQN
jgi:hypothetical protein